jgi:hypothetical protein
MNHVVLLGDSIFDNARYVPGRPAVIDQLRTWLPKGWRATLLAVDGSTASDAGRQLRGLPADASHLVVSTGGNDALGESDIVNERRAGMESFIRLAGIQQRFRDDYRAMLQAVLAVEKPTVVCTIYDAVPNLPPQAVTALSVFNDVIQQEAFRRRLPLIDLRLICNEARDYSNLSPIEPSEVGGAKIVRTITRVVTSHDFGRAESVVYGP